MAYGLGDAGTGMAASLIGFYLFIFYTAAAGLPAWMAGLVLMLARLWDAVNDPIVGWLSDKTSSRWGPRLPWLVEAPVGRGPPRAPRQILASTSRPAAPQRAHRLPWVEACAPRWLGASMKRRH